MHDIAEADPQTCGGSLLHHSSKHPDSTSLRPLSQSGDSEIPPPEADELKKTLSELDGRIESHMRRKVKKYSWGIMFGC